MNVSKLLPFPEHRTQFAWPYYVTVPEQGGCYALASYDEQVLYVGLATGNIRQRMAVHLDTPSKRNNGPLGVPFWFYYILCTPTEVGPVERGWMNQAFLEDGKMPPLNKVYSPI